MAKLKGNTLVETLVAMVVIVLCSTMAILIYTNVLSSQRTAAKLKAFYLSHEMVEQTQSRKDFLDVKSNLEELVVERKCTNVTGGLIKLDVRVTDLDNHLLWQETRFLLNE